MKKILITTSWDDGSVLDKKIVRLLRRYGLKGTFYIAPRLAGRPLLSPSDIREIAASGMEIGAHTLTHPRLSTLCLPDKEREIAGSKRELEHITGREITAFCYPKGDYDGETVELVRSAGFRFARTTACFNLQNSPDRFRVRTSIHFSRQPFPLLFRHNLRLGNLSGLMEWGRLGFETDPVRLVKKMLVSLRGSGGILHLWGHSWEIERYNMGKELEEAVRMLSKTDASFVTNSDSVL